MQAKKILEIAETAAKRYARKSWWASIPDMTQEAATAMVRAKEKWDPKVGVSLEAYLWRVAILAIKPMLLRDSAPVSAGPSKLELLKGLCRAPLPDLEPRKGGEARARPKLLKDPKPTAEVVVGTRQWKDRVWERLLALDESGGLGVSVLLGEKQPGAVAELYGVPVREVYRATSRTKKRVLDSYDMYRLWKEGP